MSEPGFQRQLRQNDPVAHAWLCDYNSWRRRRKRGADAAALGEAPRLADYRARNVTTPERLVLPLLSDAVVEHIRNAKGTASRRVVARRFGVAPSTVYAIWQGQRRAA